MSVVLVSAIFFTYLSACMCLVEGGWVDFLPGEDS